MDLLYSKYTENHKVVTFGYLFDRLGELIEEEGEIISRLRKYCREDRFDIETQMYATPVTDKYVLEVIVRDGEE